MAWIIPLAQLAYSAYSGSRARSDSRRAGRRERQLRDEQMQVFRDQIEFGRERYNDWTEMFMPLFDQMREMAADDRIDYSGVVGDATAAHDSALSQFRRERERYGIDPSDGAAEQMEQQAGLSRASSVVDALNRQRMNSADRRWNRTGQLAGMTMPLLGAGTNMMGAGISGLGASLGGAANAAGNQAMYNNNVANQNWNAFGQILGGTNWGSFFGGGGNTNAATAAQQSGNFGAFNPSPGWTPPGGKSAMAPAAPATAGLSGGGGKSASMQQPTVMPSPTPASTSSGGGAKNRWLQALDMITEPWIPGNFYNGREGRWSTLGEVYGNPFAGLGRWFGGGRTPAGAPLPRWMDINGPGTNMNPTYTGPGSEAWNNAPQNGQGPLRSHGRQNDPTSMMGLRTPMGTRGRGGSAGAWTVAEGRGAQDMVYDWRNSANRAALDNEARRMRQRQDSMIY